MIFVGLYFVFSFLYKGAFFLLFFLFNIRVIINTNTQKTCTHTLERFMFSFLKKWIWFSLPAAMRRVSHFFISCYQSKMYILSLFLLLSERRARALSARCITNPKSVPRPSTCQDRLPILVFFFFILCNTFHRCCCCCRRHHFPMSRKKKVFFFSVLSAH